MFGKRLVALRKQKGISQYILADQLNLSRGQLSNYELETREPDFETLRKITRYFDVTADYLLGFSDIQKETKSVISMPSPDHNKLPVINTIRTGLPIFAEENISTYLDIPNCIRGDYILTVKGDSMLGAGILDGDYAICQEAEDADSGQIVVILNELANGYSEVELRYCIKNGKEAIFKPANPSYPELNMNDRTRIAGSMVAIIRQVAPGDQVYNHYLAICDAPEWAEVIHLSSQAGLKVQQVREILLGQIEIAKRLRDL